MIAVNLALGRRPDCHCFGQLHSEPAGWGMVGRNLALVAVAALVLLRGPAGVGPSAVAWLGRLTPAELALTLTGGAALLLLAGILWTLLQLVRQQGRLMASIEELQSQVRSGKLDVADIAGKEEVAALGLEVGTPAPTFTVHDTHGNAVTLDGLRAAGRPVLLTFIQPGCSACKTLAPDLGRWQRELATDLTVAVISRGSAKAHRYSEGVFDLLLADGPDVANGYGLRLTPSAVLVRPNGTIGTRLTEGQEAITTLVEQITSVSQRVVLTPGQEAPSLALPDLDGDVLDLDAFRGRPLLVLFWNPGCGFCAAMLDDLRAWDADPPPGSPRLLVVSQGTREANRTLGLRSPVVVEEGALRSHMAYGVRATPSAILLDADGRVATGVARGVRAVTGLMGIRRDRWEVVPVAPGTDAAPGRS